MKYSKYFKLDLRIVTELMEGDLIIPDDDNIPVWEARKQDSGIFKLAILQDESLVFIPNYYASGTYTLESVKRFANKLLRLKTTQSWKTRLQ